MQMLVVPKPIIEQDDSFFPIGCQPMELLARLLRLVTASFLAMNYLSGGFTAGESAEFTAVSTYSSRNAACPGAVNGPQQHLGLQMVTMALQQQMLLLGYRLS